MADRPVIASPGRGASIALPSLADPAPPPMMGLGAAAAPPMPGFDLMGSFNAPAGRPLSLGAAIPIAQEAPRERRVQATGGLGAAAAPAPMAPVEPARPTALQSALGERDGELDAIYGALATPMRQVTSANPLRPIVEQEAQIWEGGGPLQFQPFTPPPIEAGESEVEYMQRVQALQAEDEQRQIQEAGTLGDVRDIGKSGYLGMREAKLQAAEGVGSAELQQAERVAQVQRDAAEMSRVATAEARAADQERRDFARVQRDAIEQAQAVQADAREKLQALPELDPNRAFKSMDGGAKFWAILGSLAGGMIGSTQVNDRLFQIAQTDLETQKANAAQTFDTAAAADAGVGQQMGLYRELLGAAGDEAAADAMFLQLQLEDAAQMLEAQLSETTVPVLQAQIQESLVGLRQQIDQQQQVIDVKLATTPHTFTRTVDPLGPRTRKKLEDRALRLEKERTDFQKMGIESEEKGLERDLKREIEGGKAKIEAARGQGGYQREAWDFAQKAAPYVAVNAALADVTERYQDKDAPGRGLSAYFWSEEGRALREDIKETMRRQLRSESGAVIGEDELEDRFNSTYSGLGDTELFSNLERLRKQNARFVQSLKAGISDDAVNFYDDNLTKRSGIKRSVQAVGGTAEQDAATLGGRVVE